MAAETQLTGNTGLATISTANSNLDGTGTLGTVITGASNGTLIKRIIIKSQGDTSEGMIRLFIYDGTNTRLLMEVKVPLRTKGSTVKTFEKVIYINYPLPSGYVLKASTQIADTFNIIAEGLDWAYYSTSVRPESTNYTGNTGIGLVSTANSNYNGTGTVSTILTAGSSGSGWNGCLIKSISVKSLVNTTRGMVRIFIQDTGSTTKLLTEVPISPITRSATVNSFSKTLRFPGGLQIQAGFKIIASTENAESFSIIVDGMDWKYPS